MCEEVLLDQRDRSEEGDQDRRDGSVHHLGIQSSQILRRVFFLSIPQALTLCLQNFAKDQGKGADKKYDFRFSPQVPCSELFLRAEQGWEGHCSYHRYFITKV